MPDSPTRDARDPQALPAGEDLALGGEVLLDIVPAGFETHGPQARDPQALDQLFRLARTYNAFTGEVGDDLLRRLYELARFGPTQSNSCPARFVFVKSAEAKAKLGPALDKGNYAKTMAAPCTVMRTDRSPLLPPTS